MTTVAAPAHRRGIGRATRHAAGLAARLACAGGLLAVLGTSITSPEMPAWLAAVAALVFAASLWRPAVSFLCVLALAPFGELLAGIPVRAAETLLYAYFAGWLLRLYQPLDRDGRVPRAVLAPAAALAAAVVASWVVIVAERSVGLAAWPLAVEVVRTLPTNYLVSAGRDPQVAAAFQLLLGIAICLSVPALAARDERLPRRVALTVAAGGLVAAAINVIDVPIRYVQSNFDFHELERYFVVTRSRLSVHISDDNAAGSHYALSSLLALGFARERSWVRSVWIAGLALLTAALWIGGSRTAMLASVAGLVLAYVLMNGWLQAGASTGRTRRALMAAGLVVLIAAAGSFAWLASRGPASREGSVAWSAGLRQQFFITSVRMTASAPVFGVGVGKYYERSAEFMPAQIRQIYGHENAHNYFAQVIAELGLAGGLIFMWFLASALLIMWGEVRTARERRLPTFGLTLASFTACAAFLLTCATSHPFLVVEAAVPFWAALGTGLALVSSTHAPAASKLPQQIAAVAVLALAATLPLRAADRFRDERANFATQGLHDDHRDDEGRVYRWTSDHAVLFVKGEPGLVVLPVRAQQVPGVDQPFELTVAVSGEVEQRVTVPTDRWLPVTVVLRGQAPSRMRRLDLRVNQTWSAKKNYGDPSDARPMGVMLGPIDYQPRPTAETRSAR